ncbi:RNA polymerase sigma-70 factor (ECF subfamily) [Haloferula luteola]|uniref:RNA polymerase sigma-70 factor (ECF subfamily) n=2 Tax=Haloferula luteola TaxID=595692 RepID=A0A840V2E0_9BACT|nr:RNA polymerase sigma-70 factor (ECF subfamily) [Haloferula luteola]
MAGEKREPLFLTTRWSLVAGAAREAEESLDALCRQYWQPVYAVARHAGHDVETAKDLTQGFFARMLERGGIAQADRSKGSFRTFLVTALKRYMVSEWRRDHAAKRGGHSEWLPWDEALAERIPLEGRDGSPDALFDRRWALTLLDAALRRLKTERDFDILKEALTAGRGETDYAWVAQQLGRSEGAARVAVHRLRKSYRAAIREEVARTVAKDADIDEEMRTLMSALA